MLLETVTLTQVFVNLNYKAWLWPYDETKRKVARSWATQIQHIEKYPLYTFAASVSQSSYQSNPNNFNGLKNSIHLFLIKLFNSQNRVDLFLLAVHGSKWIVTFLPVRHSVDNSSTDSAFLSKNLVRNLQCSGCQIHSGILHSSPKLSNQQVNLQLNKALITSLPKNYLGIISTSSHIPRFIGRGLTGQVFLPTFLPLTRTLLKPPSKISYLRIYEIHL